MNLLGIDWGEKKVGLATLENGWIDPWGIMITSKALAEIVQMCQEKKIEKVILGLPEGRLVEKIKKFGQEVARQTGLQVEFEPETLTSQDAVAKMREVGKRQQARKAEDAFAAALILESYRERTGRD